MTDTPPANTRREELAQRVGTMISNDRNRTHGDPHTQFETAQRLKDLVLASGAIKNPTHKEAIELICTKLSRIANGQPDHLDHWLDLAGYALIAGEACVPIPTVRLDSDDKGVE